MLTAKQLRDLLADTNAIPDHYQIDGVTGIWTDHPAGRVELVVGDGNTVHDLKRYYNTHKQKEARS